MGRRWAAGAERGEAAWCCSIARPAVTADGGRLPLLESTVMGRFNSLSSRFGSAESVLFNLGLVYGPALAFTS